MGGENQVEMYKKEMDTKARNVLCTWVPEKLDYLCRILDQEMWQPEYSLKAREFCINSIGEYEEKVKEIEELKKAQAQEEEVAEGEEQKEGKVEKLEGEPEEKKPKTSSSNASTLSIELKEKKSLRKVFILLLRVT